MHDLEQKLQHELDELVRKNRDVYSAVVGIQSVNHEFEWSGAAGTADAAQSHAMRVDTPIYIASVTKMYTAAATMILEESGALSLDDPLTQFLPESWVRGIHQYKGTDYSGQLTVYHLISQTSGLPDYFEQTPPEGSSVFDQIIERGDMQWDVEEVVHISKGGLSPKFPPEPMEQRSTGNKAHYSDTNYQLLGAVIESAAQKPLSNAYSDLFLEPHGLSSTYLYDHRNKRASEPATIYFASKPLHLEKAMSSFGPDGGLVSTIGDSLTFIRALMGGRLFNDQRTLKRMQNWKNIFTPFQYGFGLMRFKLPRILSPFSAPPELVGHSGASGSFLFESDVGELYIAGTLNQLNNRRLPFNFQLRLVNLVSKALS